MAALLKLCLRVFAIYCGVFGNVAGKTFLTKEAQENDGPDKKGPLQYTPYMPVASGGSNSFSWITQAIQPPTTPNPNNPWGQGVGFDSVLIGILGVIGVGVFIALGTLICRTWIRSPSFRNAKDTSIFKPCIEEMRRKRHLELYSKIRLSKASVLPVVDEEVHPLTSTGGTSNSGDGRVEHYYTNVVHADEGVTIIESHTVEDHADLEVNNDSDNDLPASGGNVQAQPDANNNDMGVDNGAYVPVPLVVPRAGDLTLVRPNIVYVTDGTLAELCRSPRSE